MTESGKGLAGLEVMLAPQVKKTKVELKVFFGGDGPQDFQGFVHHFRPGAISGNDGNFVGHFTPLIKSA